MSLSIKQRALLDLLKRVSALMEAHDIQFFLFGGSIIGALRHNGFIPWDDDIDLLISSDGYYKLLEVFKTNPPEDIDLVSIDTCTDYYRPFAMLVDKRDTCFTRPGLFAGGRALGTRLDLMIYDYVRNDRMEDYHHQLMLLQDVITNTFIADEDIYTIKDEYYAWKEREQRLGKRAVEAELRSSLEAFTEEEGADQITVRFWTPFLRHCDIDVMLEPQYHLFEGVLMPIPAKSVEYLRYLYGYDWYIVPKEEDYGHHLFYDNPFISSNNYYEDVVQFLDLEEAKQAALNRKYVQIERMASKKRVQQTRANFMVQRVLLQLDLDKNADRIHRWRTNCEYRQVTNYMTPLIDVSAYALSVDVPHKRIPDAIILDWIYSCILAGTYYNAIKVCDMMEIDEDDPLWRTDEVQLLVRVKALAAAYQDEAYSEIDRLLDAFSEEEKAVVPDCILAYARSSAEGAHYDAQTVIALCDAYLAVVDDNWDIVKLRGDAMWLLGQTEEAMECYMLAHENTTNGLDLLDLETRFDFAPRFISRPDEDYIVLLAGDTDEAMVDTEQSEAVDKVDIADGAEEDVR